MKKILYITNMAKQIHHVREVEAKGRIEAKEHFKIDLYNLKQEPEWNESWEQRLKTSDVVIMKHMGTGLDTPFYVVWLIGYIRTILAMRCMPMKNRIWINCAPV